MPEKPRRPDPEESAYSELLEGFFETLGAFVDVPPEWRGEWPPESERPRRPVPRRH